MEETTVAIFKRAHMCYYESNNKKITKQVSLFAKSRECADLWEQVKTRYDMPIASFSTLPAACHHAGFRAMNLFFSANGRNPAPLHSDFLSPAPVGEEKQAVMIVLIHYSHFHLLFSQPLRSEKGFVPYEKSLLPKYLHPRDIQYKHLSHCCIWSTVLV